MSQKQQIQLSKKQEKILEYMVENPIQSVSELEYRFNASRTYILELLNVCYTYYLEENGNSHKNFIKQEEEINALLSNERESEKVISTLNDSDKDKEINTNDDIQRRKEKEIATFEVPVVYRYPLVYTTRLDEMCIMQKYLGNRKPINIIYRILWESKRAKIQHSTGTRKKCRCAKGKHKIAFNHLQSVLRLLSGNNDVMDVDENISRVPEKRINSSADDSSDEEVLANIVKRKKDANSNSILYDTQSESNVDNEEDETVVIGLDIYEKSNDKFLEFDRYTTLVNSLSKFIDLKIIHDMKTNHTNMIVIINNEYSQLTDIYVTDVSNNIFEFVTVPYGDFSLVYKLFSTDNKMNLQTEPLHIDLKYGLLYIDCCCWLKRQNEINSRFSTDFMKLLFTPHPCCVKCSCCCYKRKEPNNSDKSELNVVIADKNSIVQREGFSKITSKNPLLEKALNFNKPKQLRQNRILNKNISPQICHSPMSIHFQFKHTAVNNRKNMQLSNKKRTYSEFIDLDTKRDIVFHNFNVFPSGFPIIESIVLSIKGTTMDVCCKANLKHLTKILCVQYNIKPNVFKYLDNVHKYTIYKKENRFIDRCRDCKDRYRTDYGSKVTMNFRTVLVPIEHIRKSIVGRAVKLKTDMLEQTKCMEEKSKTIQEMIEKLEEKFPNISFFINDVGLPVASLPKPYQCYPPEDFKILTQVLEFSQSKILNQLQLPAGTEVKLKNIRYDTVGSSKTDSLFEQPVNMSIQKSSKMPNNESDKHNPKPTTSKHPYDFCSMLIKCNNVSYVKSFESFTKSSIIPNEVPEELILPTITNVCSLSENNEIAKQLSKVVNMEGDSVVTIIDD